MRPDVEEFSAGISFDAYRLLGSHPAGPGRGWLFYPVGTARPPRAAAGGLERLGSLFRRRAHLL